MSTFSGSAQTFDAVRLRDGKPVFEYRPHNYFPGAEPDFYEVDSVVLSELPELASKILRASSPAL